MHNLVLVDTSAWICFFARKGFIEIKEVISQLLEDNRAAIAGPIVVELIQGARTDKERDDIKSRIKGLHWFHITDKHWQRAANLAFDLRRRGITTSAIDSLLTVIAISYHCQILHKDSDFGLIAKHSLLKLFDVVKK